MIGKINSLRKRSTAGWKAIARQKRRDIANLPAFTSNPPPIATPPKA